MQNSAALKELLSYPELTKVVPLENYCLKATFANGEVKVVDIKPYFEWEVFQPLKNVDLFNKAHADFGGVVWNEKIDLAQEALYDKGTLISNSAN